LQASRRRIEELLWAFGLSRVTAPLWEKLRGGKAMRQSRLMRDFYSELLPKSALVFDIGANIGTMTRVFLSLGARVIAVEPNPDCARHIELTTPGNSVEVLQAAAGETNGLAVLKVSDRKDKMSSLSNEWREAVSRENADYAGMWKREVTVPTITLDALIQRYGEPWYIKIDVEGYEEQVVKGLSQCPSLLSFEFSRVFLEPALKALDGAIFDDAVFNYTLVDPVQFELRDWVGRDEVRSAILGLRDGAGLGDIFVKRRS
jgi:FkbM family methyltransferase